MAALNAASSTGGGGGNAILNLAGCTANILPPNDDGSTGSVPLPFTLNFFGRNYNALWVNNNGNVTFDGPLRTYTPFGLTTTQHVIIAPFFADVDTTGTGSSPVTYGSVTYNGQPAFCVNWVNVGYFQSHADKLNSFQLLLIDRPDTGAGNFDIMMNYNQIQWETGDASNGTGGLGGSSAHVGYSNGSTTSFELPGSGVNGAFLDTNAQTGLIHGDRGSLTPGQYVYAVRNGVAPTGGSISGTIYANSATAGNEVPNAYVQVCGTAGNIAGFCNTTTSNGSGQYLVSGLQNGSYTITAFSPTGSSLAPASITTTLTGGAALSGQNLVLTGPTPPPNGTTITGPTLGPATTSDGLPNVYWQDALTLTTHACANGTANYSILQNGAVIQSGAMTETPTGSGVYKATVPPLYPHHDNATVQISVHCPTGPSPTFEFNIYIDPSGFVTDTAGHPIAGATVTLYRSDSASGPFVQVPDGSGIMSPLNRHNPDTTTATGAFGWDVLAGYYEVRASAPGCVSPTNPSQTYVQSPVLTIPPAVLNVTLQLNCSPSHDTTPPTTTATVAPAPNALGWTPPPTTVTLAALDNAGGSGVKQITYSAVGAQPIASTTVTGSTAAITISAPGVTTITYWATDNAGNAEAPKTVTVKVYAKTQNCTVEAALQQGHNELSLLINSPRRRGVLITGVEGSAIFEMISSQNPLVGCATPSGADEVAVLQGPVTLFFPLTRKMYTDIVQLTVGVGGGKLYASLHDTVPGHLADMTISIPAGTANSYVDITPR